MEIVTFVGEEIVRGNHYHLGYHERAFVQEGCVEITLRALDDPDERHVIELGAGELLDIPQRTIHTFISKCPSVVVCFGYGTSPATDRHYFKDDS